MEIRRFLNGQQELAYRVDGDGPALVLIHSYLANSAMWLAEIELLKARYTVVTVDLRGHGKSAPSRPHTLYDLVDDVLAVLDHAGINQAIWCGLSIGGMITMRASLRYPNRVIAMLLLNTDGMSEAPKVLVKHKFLKVLARFFGLKPVVGTVLKMMFGQTARREQPELIRHWRDDLAQVHVDSMMETLVALDERDDVLADLASCDIPALVIHGDEDTAIHPFRGKALADAIPNAQYHLCEGVGHLSNLEQPDRIAGLIMPFLETIATK